MTDRALYHSVADELITLIDAGDYELGSRLPSERDLAVKFKVSRTVVREAQIALQAKGIIETRTGSGTYILNKPKFDLYGFATFNSFELIEARALIETESAALAAPIITEENIKELENYIEIMSGRVKTNMTPLEADAAFHNTLSRATNNDVIILIVESMWKIRTESNRLQAAYEKVCETGCSRHLEDEHVAIVEALKARNPAAARKSMRAHFSRLIEALLIASEEEAQQEVRRKASEHRSRFLLSTQLV